MADDAGVRLTDREQESITDAFADALSELTMSGDFAAALEKTKALPLVIEHLRAQHFAGSVPKAKA